MVLFRPHGFGLGCWLVYEWIEQIDYYEGWWDINGGTDDIRIVFVIQNPFVNAMLIV